MNLPKKVQILEVGMRDGLQNIKDVLLSVEQKLLIIEGLEQAGHKNIQIGSFVHPKAVPQMKNTDEVFQQMNRKAGVEYSAAPIPNLRALDRGIACGCDTMRLAVSVSRAHNMKNYNCLPTDTIRGFREIINKALDNRVKLGAGLMMAFGSPWEGEIPISLIEEMIDVFIDYGLTNEINLSDTSGMAVPTRVYQTCVHLKERYPQVENWTLHLHNTRGTGLTNMFAGMQAGVSRFETAFAGFGGCPFVPNAAGNISTEDAVHMLQEMGIETGIDIDKQIQLSQTVERMVGLKGESFVMRAGPNKDLLAQIC